MARYSVAVVGATGIVGQQAISVLNGHPEFTVDAIVASERSAGKRYVDAISKDMITEWYAEGDLPENIADMKLENAATLNPKNYDMIFSCVESEVARILEPQYAKHCPVISTASAFRYNDDVPLIIPSVNPDHAKLIELQRKNRGWDGFVCPIPNCTTTGLAITLKPLQDKFGVKNVMMTSLQAISGAGRSPGVKALDIVDNVIPFISGEEEKVEMETQKILNKKIGVSCTCMRVAVLEGHTESVFVQLEKDTSVDEVMDTFRKFSPPVKTHSTPKQIIKVFTDPSRPQPRLDRDTGNGLTTCVGRIRKDEFGFKYVLLSHNTKMGAAAGAIWLAEMLVKKGYIG